MKPTKQQAICLKLAQWLEIQSIQIDGILYAETIIGAGVTYRQEFNPFSDSTEGRAQFAECYFRAVCVGVQIRPQRWVIFYEYEGVNSSVTHDNTPKGIASATLEAIFYAIGGTAGEWE